MGRRGVLGVDKRLAGSQLATRLDPLHAHLRRALILALLQDAAGGFFVVVILFAELGIRHGRCAHTQMLQGKKYGIV